MKKRLISVIIPAYNEESIIANSIMAVKNNLSSLKRPFELVVIDDGSKDSTPTILNKLKKNKKYKSLRVIYYKNGPSRRENLAKSFKLLKGEYIILLDMDISMDLRHVKDIIHWLEQGYGIVIPNRYHPKSHIKRNPKRYIISKLYNSFIRILFNTGFKDNICGFKGFKRDVITKLVKESGIDKTQSRSVFWDTEILIRALSNGIPIKEIPVHWEEGKKSSLNFRREIKMLPYIIKFWLKFNKRNIKR